MGRPRRRVGENVTIGSQPVDAGFKAEQDALANFEKSQPETDKRWLATKIKNFLSEFWSLSKTKILLPNIINIE